MDVALLAPNELPELEEFFRRLDLHMPRENFLQFATPRAFAPGLEVGTAVIREGGCILGSISWIEVPVRINDERGMPLEPDRLRTGRWVLNFFLMPELRGRGIGHQLIDALHAGCPLRFVIGSTTAAQRAFDKVGYRDIGRLSMLRWARPCLDPARLADRFRHAERQPPPAIVTLRSGSDVVVARRLERPTGPMPWAAAEVAGAPYEAGVPRDAAYLDYAYGGHLQRCHTLHTVTVNDAPVGFFVLAARATRLPVVPVPLLAAEVVDLDALPGRESQVILAARKTAFACADVTRIRICGDRFTRVLTRLVGRREVPDHPLRVSIDPGSVPDAPCFRRAGSWRLTYGDHDQFRVRATSQRWMTSPAGSASTVPGPQA